MLLCWVFLFSHFRVISLLSRFLSLVTVFRSLVFSSCVLTLTFMFCPQRCPCQVCHVSMFVALCVSRPLFFIPVMPLCSVCVFILVSPGVKPCPCLSLGMCATCLMCIVFSFALPVSLCGNLFLRCFHVFPLPSSSLGVYIVSVFLHPLPKPLFTYPCVSMFLLFQAFMINSSFILVFLFRSVLTIRLNKWLAFC